MKEQSAEKTSYLKNFKTEWEMLDQDSSNLNLAEWPEKLTDFFYQADIIL